MNLEDIVKTIIAMTLDMDYADYIEFADETVKACIADLEFLQANKRGSYLMPVLRQLAEVNSEQLEWYKNIVDNNEE